jgi:hypothetical protein
VQNKNKHTSIVTTVTPVSPGIPRAMVLTVSFVLSPVTGLVCHRHRRIWRVKARSGRHASANLTPASGRQDHTTSPSAAASFVSAPFDRSQAFSNLPCDRVARLTLPASKASRPASVTIASRPSVGRDAMDIDLIWVKPERKNFCKQG